MNLFGWWPGQGSDEGWKKAESSVWLMTDLKSDKNQDVSMINNEPL